MSKDYEYEAKVLISKELFDNLVSSLETEYMEQTNIYFDQEENLKSNNMGLRVRVKADEYELTLKHRFESHNLEINAILNKHDYRALMGSYVINNKEVTDYLDAHAIKYDRLEIITTFQTLRYVSKLENAELFLDKNVFENGNVDYELEVESSSMEISEAILKKLLGDDVKFNIKSKIARAMDNK